jgi:glycosyltransferase involved in cell wall biosynthesis
MTEIKREKPTLVLAVTVPFSMFFFKGQIDYLKKAGFNIVVICSPGWDNSEGVDYYPIPMEREISILKDIRSLFRLIKLLVKIKPDIVNAGTPKAGLLVSIAAFISNVPFRIYTCHGLRLETLAGWKRKILTITERITTLCVNEVVCVSCSLRNKMVDLKLAPEHKVKVIGAGSCNGVDLAKFSGDFYLKRIEDTLKEKNIAKDAIFIGFIGRLVKDKGIYELVEAFEILKRKFPNLYLLLLGGHEKGDPISEETSNKIIQDQRIIDLDFIVDTVPYYQLMRTLVLPTYREGLPTVLLEAGAMGVPVVATWATGCVDVIEDGRTGLLVPPGDSVALANAIEVLLVNESLAIELGENARRRIEQLYSQEVVWCNIINYYREKCPNSIITGIQLER